MRISSGPHPSYKAIAFALDVWGGAGPPIFAKSRVSTPKCSPDCCKTTCRPTGIIANSRARTPSPPGPLAVQGCMHGLAIYAGRPCTRHKRVCMSAAHGTSVCAYRPHTAQASVHALCCRHWFSMIFNVFSMVFNWFP